MSRVRPPDGGMPTPRRLRRTSRRPAGFLRSRVAEPTPATWDPPCKRPACPARRFIRRRRLRALRPIPIQCSRRSANPERVSRTRPQVLPGRIRQRRPQLPGDSPALGGMHQARCRAAPPTMRRNQARRRHSFRAAFHRSRHRWSGCRADTLHSRVPFRRNPADPSPRRHSVRQAAGRRRQRRSLPHRAQIRR